MNLPNRLTVARFFLTIGFVVAMSASWAYANTVALLLFIVAALTDYADGYIARKYDLITDFGKLMDPLVDKIMVAGAFICLIPNIPAWAVVVIISREFLITGLRLLAASKGEVLPAESVGKHKTGWQIATVIYFLVVLSAEEHGLLSKPREQFTSAVGAGLILVAVGLTLYSGAGYLWRNRGLITAAK